MLIEACTLSSVSYVLVIGPWIVVTGNCVDTVLPILIESQVCAPCDHDFWAGYLTCISKLVQTGSDRMEVAGPGGGR